jgi:hypothetical protein
LKGKGHQVVAVENLLKILKGLKKMTIICSKANLSQVSKIGLCESRKASLPLGLSSVEKEFYVEEHHRIDSGHKLNLAKKQHYFEDSGDEWI